ncbi:hypothetical protein K449DRAFT_440184 [Hypoxylon sp. EC38]|nr:hypothetical protein K449DRAFT_440184 [Hypoxylon sp. EC38]
MKSTRDLASGGVWVAGGTANDFVRYFLLQIAGYSGTEVVIGSSWVELLCLLSSVRSIVHDATIREALSRTIMNFSFV